MAPQNDFPNQDDEVNVLVSSVCLFQETVCASVS